MIFLGDFTDRGPYQKEVINIVRPMIDQGYALSVMGNHEFNAIAYATKNQSYDDYLRKHSDKNTSQHQAFLNEYPFGSQQHHEVIEWFKTLPLWLDLGKFRVIHACWDAALIEKLKPETQNQRLTGRLIQLASDENTWQFGAVETILKGKEIQLPEGMSFNDKDGNPRHHIRVRWWDQSATDYRAAFLGPESAKTHIPEDKISGDRLLEYGHGEKPVFLGHYWMEGTIEILAPNIACVDYSVAKPGKSGKLVAYCFNCEKQLHTDHFVSVERLEH